MTIRRRLSFAAASAVAIAVALASVGAYVAVRAKLLLIALELLLSNLLEHGSEQFVGDDRALVDAPALRERSSAREPFD